MKACDGRTIFLQPYNYKNLHNSYVELLCYIRKKGRGSRTWKLLSAAIATDTDTTTYLLEIHMHRLKYTHLMFKNLEITVCLIFL